ncbi:MAG: aminoacyl-tRNA hydrolase [Thermodesulfobacteriota bacterium]
MDALPAGPVLVAGLGNPGPRYAATRHNLGFMAVEELAARLGVGITRKGHQSLWGEGRLGGRKLILALPQTYMNLSGQAVASLMHYFDLEPQRVVVVHDDLDQEPGRLKVARKGGAGGHRGVASILEHLGDDRFVRLKLGIGRPRYDEGIEDYVLCGFYADQRGLFENVVKAAAECLEVIVTEGPQAAMQRYHRVSLKEEVEG